MRQKLILFLAAALSAGCRDDGIESSAPFLPDGSVSLNVAISDPVRRDMGTRADVADFGRLDDLNIVIAEGGGDEARILTSVFFEPGSTASGTSIVGGSDLVVYTGDGSDFNVHFSKEWLDHMQIPATSTFFLVGNYGERIAVADVGTLRRLRDSSASGTEGWVGPRHMMFAETVADPDSNHADQPGHEGGISLKGELKRTAAMITVAIDGSGLARGVIITPQSISLHNVPAWCLLGERNIVTDGPLSTEPLPDAVSPDGEILYASDLKWGMVVGTATTGLSNTRNAVGAHYTDWQESPTTPTPPAGIDWNDPDIRPLFMYENVHGEGFGEPNTDEKFKRPRDVEDNATDIAAATRACSYLEVRATYQKLNNAGALKIGGNVSFRVFLGKNILDDFDVERNSYYRFTLCLSGDAVTEGGQMAGGEFRPNPAAVTWRVESDLSNVSMLSESGFTLNAGGEMIFVDELLAKPNESGFIVDYQGQTQAQVNNNRPYLHIVMGNDWWDFPLTSSVVGGNNVKMNSLTPDRNMQFRLYVDPMTPTDGAGANQGYVRQVTFQLESNSGNYISENLTITQYGPIVRQIRTDNTSVAIQNYVTDVLGRSLPLTLYIDRVDRTSMPWGFDGVPIATNQSSGFANGAALIGNAAPYLPFGKPNSAMMHAAFMNYYNQASTPSGFTQNQNPPNPTIAAISGVTASRVPIPNSIPSRAEWILLEMLDNEFAGGLFDDRHPVLPWFSYWTSDAVAGTTQAYAYQVDQHLTGADLSAYPPQFIAARTSPLRYRFIHIEQ